MSEEQMPAGSQRQELGPWDVLRRVLAESEGVNAVVPRVNHQRWFGDLFQGIEGLWVDRGRLVPQSILPLCDGLEHIDHTSKEFALRRCQRSPRGRLDIEDRLQTRAAWNSPKRRAPPKACSTRPAGPRAICATP